MESSSDSAQDVDPCVALRNFAAKAGWLSGEAASPDVVPLKAMLIGGARQIEELGLMAHSEEEVITGVLLGLVSAHFDPCSALFEDRLDPGASLAWTLYPKSTPGRLTEAKVGADFSIVLLRGRCAILGCAAGLDLDRAQAA